MMKAGVWCRKKSEINDQISAFESESSLTIFDILILTSAIIMYEVTMG